MTEKYLSNKGRKEMPKKKIKSIAYVINVDWYFILHWLDRALHTKENGFDVFVLTKITESKNRNILEDLGFKVINIDFIRASLNPISEIKTHFQIRNQLKKIEPDITHAVTIKPNLHISIITKHTKIRTILSFPGLGELINTKRLSSRLLWLITCITLKRNTKVTATFENSHDSELFFRSGVRFSKVEVFPGAGVDTDKFHYQKPPSEEKLKVLFAARLLKSKGLPLLVDAIKILKKENQNIELHVAGIEDNDNKDSISFSQIKKWERDNLLVWHGTIDNMTKLIHTCHLICLPTLYGEGLPRILIEAAACGRPSISSDVPGCNEFIENNVTGFLVKPGSITELLNAIRFFIKDQSEIIRMGRNASKKVELGYNNKIVIDKNLTVYH